MTKKAPSIVFAGGGTAGHINPMLAIARAIRDLEANAKDPDAGHRRQDGSRAGSGSWFRY